MKTYAIYRLVRFQLGSASVLPVALFESLSEAQKQCRELDAKFRHLLDANLRDHATNESMDLKVKDLLFSLGIQHIGHQVLETDVHQKSQLFGPTDNVVPLRPVD